VKKQMLDLLAYLNKKNGQFNWEAGQNMVKNVVD